MTRQEARLLAHRKRREKKAAEEEKTLMQIVKDRQKEVLSDPYKRHWNKYNCWNYRTIEGILKDASEGWIFEVRDGNIVSINNPLIDEKKKGVSKISYNEYQKLMEGVAKDEAIVNV